MNISFFIADGDQVISVDIEAVKEITTLEFLQLTPEEQSFVVWVISQISCGLISISIIGRTSEILDSSQYEICTEFLRMIGSPTLQDPDIF